MTSLNQKKKFIMIQKIFIFVVVLVILATTIQGGLYGKNSKVIQLSAGNFASEVFGSSDVWMVEFYAPWCGHCKRLTPEWERAAAKLEGFVNVAAIDCDVEANKGLAGYFGIKGFPTIKFFGHKTEPSPDGKGVVKKSVDYQGAREAGPIVQYALSKLPDDFVSALTDKSGPAWFQEHTEHGQVVLFTDKPRTTSLYKALSLQFADRMHFAQVHSATGASIATDFGVTEFPTLVVVDGGERHQYSGALKIAPIADFIGQYAPPAAKKKSASESRPPPPPPPEPFQVYELTSQALFQEKCVDKPGLCVIGFFDETNDDHASYTATFDSVATSNQKNFRFFRVDAVGQSQFTAAFDVTWFPGVVAYSPSKSLYMPFVGSFSQERLDSFLSSVLRGKKRPVSLDEQPLIN
jgi:protein disulfide-isomerase A6